MTKLGPHPKGVMMDDLPRIQSVFPDLRLHLRTNRLLGLLLSPSLSPSSELAEDGSYLKECSILSVKKLGGAW